MIDITQLGRMRHRGTNVTNENKRSIYQKGFGYIPVLLILFAFIPGVSHALGLGELTVKSYLGAPLKLEIILNSGSKKELTSLNLGLASRAEFSRAGIEYPLNAAAFNFTVTHKLSGRSVVHITTLNPELNTFLHLLVSATWSGGKIIREYTALLDPPLFDKQPPGTVVLPSTEGISNSRSSSPGRGTTTVKVRRGDTLSGILQNLDIPSDITMQQGLQSILEQNSDAFIKGNMNLLKAGRILSIPSFAAMRQVSRTKSLQLFQQQMASFLASKKPPAPISPPAVQEFNTVEATPDKSEIVSSDDEMEDDQLIVSEEEGEAQLRIAQGIQEQGATTDGNATVSNEVGKIQQELNSLDESILASGSSNEEIKNRLKSIQQQVDRFSALLEIEDRDLALAQENAIRSEPPQEQEITTTEGDNFGMDTTISEKEDLFANEGDITEEDPLLQSILDQGEFDDGSSEVTEQEFSSDDLAAIDQDGTPEDVIEDADDSNAIPDNTTQMEEGSIQSISQTVTNVMATLYGYISNSILLIFGLVLVLLFGLLIYRRRTSESEYEESIFDLASEQVSVSSSKSPDISSEAENVVPSTAQNDNELTVGSMSFLTETSTTGGESDVDNDVVQTSDVDPVAEAEVYLAYNRDEQAIQVLREAYNEHPERIELAEKLLGIFHKQDDRLAFDGLAKEVYNRMGSGTYPNWARVASMGREVNPDNSLYKDSEQDSQPQQTEITQPNKTEINNISNLESNQVSVSPKNEYGLSQGNVKIQENADINTFDDQEIDDIASTLDTPTLSQMIENPEFEVDGIEDLKIHNVGHLPADTVSDAESEKFLPSENVPSGSTDTSAPEDDTSVPDDQDSTVVKEESTMPCSEDSMLKQTTEPVREAETALELAKAYIELGEKDTARGFIEEVINAGDQQQVNKAKELAKELVD